MRRPVGVKSILDRLGWGFSLPSLPLSPCFHPHSRGAIRIRSVHVGSSRFSRCCHLFGALFFSTLRRWARRLTQSPERGFRLLIFLSQRCFCFYAASTVDRRWLLCN